MKLKVTVSESEYNHLDILHRLEQHHETLRARLDIIFQAVVIVCSDISYNYNYVTEFIYNADISKINAILCCGMTGNKLFQYILDESNAYKRFG